MSGDGRTGRDRSRSRPRTRGRRGGNPWRASQVARYDRGVSSAIDFASPADLARSPPRASSARGPEPPPGPPPGYSEGSGSWQWVWSWVPDRQPRDVRDGPLTSSAGEGGASDPVSTSSRRGPRVSRASVSDRPEAKAAATTPRPPSAPKATSGESFRECRSCFGCFSSCSSKDSSEGASSLARARLDFQWATIRSIWNSRKAPKVSTPTSIATREGREVLTPQSAAPATREDREGSRHPASAKSLAKASGTRAVRETSSTASLTSTVNYSGTC